MIFFGLISVLIWSLIFFYRLVAGKGVAYFWYLLILGGIAFLVYSDPSIKTAFIGLLWALISTGSLIALPFFYKTIFQALDKPFSYEKEKRKKEATNKTQADEIIAKAKSHPTSQKIQEELEEEKANKFEEDQSKLNQLYSEYSHLVSSYLSKFDELSPSMPYIFAKEGSGRGISVHLSFIDMWFTHKVFGKGHFFTPFMKLEIYRSYRNDDVWIIFYSLDDELLETKIILDKDTTPLKIESIFEEGWKKLLHSIKAKKIEDEFLKTYAELKNISDKEGISIEKLCRNLSK